MIILILSVESCNNPAAPKIVRISKNEIIQKVGVYKVISTNMQITVINISGVINIIAADSLNNICFSQTKPKISSFQRWAMLVDDKDNVWIYSSDVGTLVWNKVLSGKYEMQFFMLDEKNKKKLPKKIYDFFPSSVK